MNFYKRYIGDIQAKTGGLSLAEFGAYDRLLDHYYATEKPLPLDIAEVHRIARAMNSGERKAVDRVLEKFFLQTDLGYVQSKAEEVIAEARPKIEAARSNGAKGGRPRKTNEQPTGFQDEKPTGLNVETQSGENGKAIQNQIPTSPSLRSGEDAPKSKAVSLKTYLEVCRKEGRKPIPPDHPIREYCRDAGIADEMLQVAWLMFKDRHTTGEKTKRYKDWPTVFKKSVESRWYGLWIVNAEGAAEWSSTGLQQKRVLEARLRKMEEPHAA